MFTSSVSFGRIRPRKSDSLCLRVESSSLGQLPNSLWPLGRWTYSDSILTLSGALRMYSLSPSTWTSAGSGTIHTRDDEQVPFSRSWYSSPSSVPGWMSLPTSFFSRRSAWSMTRPTSVRPMSASTMRSGSVGLRFTQNVEGFSSNQTKKASELSRAAFVPAVGGVPPVVEAGASKEYCRPLPSPGSER